MLATSCERWFVFDATGVDRRQWQRMDRSCLKRFIIDSGGNLKKVLRFDVASAPSLSVGLRSGLRAYATDVPKVGPCTTLWLQLCDGRTLRVRSDMHDLSGWEEIGTLTFELVRAGDYPEVMGLPAPWSEVRAIEKLVYDSAECEAECGFALHTMSGDSLLVVPGADVYTLAIKAPFFPQPFSPENDLVAYIRKEF